MIEEQDLDPETLEFLIDRVLYGTTNKTPYEVLFEQQGKDLEVSSTDFEDQTRVDIAATFAGILKKINETRFRIENGCPKCGANEVHILDKESQDCDEYACYDCKSLITVYPDLKYEIIENAI